MIGILLFLFLPGYLLLRKLKMTKVESVIFGMPVGVAVVTVAIYILNITDMAPINKETVILVILGASLVVAIQDLWEKINLFNKTNHK